MKSHGRTILVMGFFVFVTSALFIHPAHAQWAYTYGGTGFDSITSMEQTADGGHIAAGYTTSFGLGSRDLWVLKLDTNGNIVWEKTYGGQGLDQAGSVQQTNDGGYIVAGYTYSSGAGDADFWVLKLDNEGIVLWQKTYGGNKGDIATSVLQTQDGGYVVGGYTYSFGLGESDFSLLKLDSNGNVTWQYTYGGTSTELFPLYRQTLDGGYVMAGQTLSFGTGAYDAWLMKLDSDGGIVWQKAFGGTGDDFAVSIEQTQDGGYVVAGYTDSFGAIDFDLWIVKLNEGGDITWQKRYTGSNGDIAKSVRQTQDGGYIVSGLTNYAAGSSRDAWIMKVDENGGVTWHKTFGGKRDEYVTPAYQTQDGGYIVAGRTESFGAGTSEAWVLKLDSAGACGSCPYEAISTVSITDTAATVTDTSATPIISTALVTDTAAAAINTAASVALVCPLAEKLNILKVGTTKKRGGDGIITSLDGLVECPDSCQASYNPNVVITLLGEPLALSTFLGWKPASLRCDGTDPCQVTMDKRKSVKAVFRGPNKLKTGTIFRKGGAGTVTSGDGGITCPGDCEEAYVIGDSVTLTASPTQGTFAGWSGKPCKGEPSNECTFVMDKNYAVKAIFEGNP